MIKPKLWKGEDLEGEWEATWKIDGVRALIKNGVALSRSNKPLYNLFNVEDGDYEIYCGDWESSITAVRTIEGEEVDEEHVYSLDPIDSRLLITTVDSPTSGYITMLLDEAMSMGYEGLVLRQDTTWLKVKPTETYDVQITGVIEGKGRNINRLGAFVTEMGNVGTGLSDADREELYTLPKGTIIEVGCMHLTKEGKFRHPRFKRVRWDK